MPKTAQLCLAAAVAALAGCGSGDEMAAGPSIDGAAREAPRYADEDRDGRVTRAEAEVDPLLAAGFDRFDADADGALDQVEFARLEAGAAEPAGESRPEQRQPLRPRDEYPRPYR